MITKNDLDWWLELEGELDWQFATTFAESAPHEYVVTGRTSGISAGDLVRAAHVIRTFGEPMKFYKTTRIYLVTGNGWKHWDMQGGTIDDPTVGVINRCRVDHVYGIQNMPRTASGVSSPYDGLASTWDRDHGMSALERAETADVLRATFGDTLWRTLDVGCGTGLALDLGLAEPVRYAGIDPSTAMLNGLVVKHPVVAGVHPMTYADAERRRVLGGSRFDTVMALGGSASYLTPEDLDRLRSRAKRAVLLMHYAPDAAPPVADLGRSLAEASLHWATARARAQRRIGRFVASVVAAREFPRL